MPKTEKAKIEFVLLSPEQAEAHIKKLQPLKITRTEGISDIAKSVHEKAATAITHLKPGGISRIVIESLIGHVHALAVNRIWEILKEKATNTSGISTADAIERTSDILLRPEKIRIIVRGGMAILWAHGKTLEIPKSAEQEIEVSSIDELKAALEELIKLHVRPTEKDSAHDPSDIKNLRTKLKSIRTKDKILRAVINKLLTKTMLLASKQMRPTQQSLLQEFVENISKLAATVRTEEKVKQRIEAAKKTRVTRATMEDLDGEDDGAEYDEIAGLLEEKDLKLFKKNDRKEGTNDYKDEKQRKEKWKYDQGEYKPEPEDFEDKPEKPDSDDET